MILRHFFDKLAGKTNERRIYEAIVAQARQPWFYAELDVPDTVEGRYDMIMLHSFLVIDRLSVEVGNSRGFAQRLFDEMFKDMDQSLREMGVGDLSVGKKIRKMAEAFYGRAEAYKVALNSMEGDDGAALQTVLARNVYSTDAQTKVHDLLAQYVLQVHACLSRQHSDTITAGDIRFPIIGVEYHAASTPST